MSEELNGVENVMERINAGEAPDRMSCGEQIVAAFLCNRMDWLPSTYQHPVDALNRLGSKWLEMMLEYRRNNE